MIEAIIFDLGNVIVSVDFTRMLAKWAGLCGRGPEEVRATVWASGLAQRYETGRLDDVEFYQAVTALLGVSLSYEEFAADWGDVFGPPLLGDEFIAPLAERYPLWALSDTCPAHVARLWPGYGPLRYFRGGVFSYQVGAMKPDAAMFRAVTERAGVAPEHCFYTDDRQANVESARACGLNAVRYETPAQLAQDLRAQGVRWR
jgi:putative hydrolase of the HAD superfamily